MAVGRGLQRLVAILHDKKFIYGILHIDIYVMLTYMNSIFDVCNLNHMDIISLVHNMTVHGCVIDDERVYFILFCDFDDEYIGRSATGCI